MSETACRQCGKMVSLADFPTGEFVCPECGWRELMPNAVAMDTLSLCKLGHLEDGDPEELGEQMAELAQRFPHINVWGGCCGTDGRHIGQIAEQVGAARQAMAAE